MVAFEGFQDNPDVLFFFPVCECKGTSMVPSKYARLAYPIVWDIRGYGVHCPADNRKILQAAADGSTS